MPVIGGGAPNAPQAQPCYGQAGACAPTASQPPMYGEPYGAPPASEPPMYAAPYGAPMYGAHPPGAPPAYGQPGGYAHPGYEFASNPGMMPAPGPGYAQQQYPYADAAGGPTLLQQRPCQGGGTAGKMAMAAAGGAALGFGGMALATHAD